MIPFNRPHLTGKEAEYIRQALAAGKLSGNGEFTKRCQNFLEERYGFRKCLLTTSGTDALEMAALLTGVGSGDEVIVPSYTFVSTALAFLRCGAKVVFADSRDDEPNLDATKIESLITPRTKVIVPVHYAGCACDMDAIMEIANRHNLLVVEDAAQAIDACYLQPAKSAQGEVWTLAAVDGGSISMGIRAKTFAPLANASSYDIKTCLAVSNGTFAVTVSAFNFGIHQTDADCVSPTISLAGTNPVFSTEKAFTFGSDAELANPPVLELMPAPGGFAEPAIRTGGEAVTIGSNVKVCVKLADLIAQNESKVTVDIARVPADGTLNVDVAQLKANTEFVGAKTWTADYAVVDVVEDGGAAYKVLRGTFRSQGLLLFVR